VTAPNALTCRELVALVTEYLEDTLSPADQARFEAHVAGCPACRTYLDQIRQTVRVLGRLPDRTIEPAAQEQLLRLFRDWKSGRSTRP
jgi:anti-sigma factor RsiW